MRNHEAAYPSTREQVGQHTQHITISGASNRTTILQQIVQNRSERLVLKHTPNGGGNTLEKQAHRKYYLANPQGTAAHYLYTKERQRPFASRLTSRSSSMSHLLPIKILFTATSACCDGKRGVVAREAKRKKGGYTYKNNHPVCGISEGVTGRNLERSVDGYC